MKNMSQFQLYLHVCELVLILFDIMRACIVDEKETLASLVFELLVDPQNPLLKDISPHPRLFVRVVADVWKSRHVDVFVAAWLGSRADDQWLQFFACTKNEKG